jgi:hypothetical protein
MNSQKGLDRIILLLAAIAIAPGIILGGSYAIRNFKELTPEYSEYIKNPSVWKVKEIAECRKEFDARKDTDNTVSINVGDGIYRIEGFTEFCGKYSNPPEKYKSKVATWKKKASATIGGVQGFLIVFIGLNGLRSLFLWIVAGFKNEDKENDS